MHLGQPQMVQLQSRVPRDSGQVLQVRAAVELFCWSACVLNRCCGECCYSKRHHCLHAVLYLHCGPV